MAAACFFFSPQHQHGPECIAHRRCRSVGKRGNCIKLTQARVEKIRYRTQKSIVEIVRSGKMEFHQYTRKLLKASGTPVKVNCIFHKPKYFYFKLNVTWLKTKQILIDLHFFAWPRLCLSKTYAIANTVVFTI
jgi:hypothetical protein